VKLYERQLRHPHEQHGDRNDDRTEDYGRAEPGWTSVDVAHREAKLARPGRPMEARAAALVPLISFAHTSWRALPLSVEPPC
jgi:hypothetical protein